MMDGNDFTDKGSERERKNILVALDFFECSNAAYRKACDMFVDRIGAIIALHVIDSEFVKRCVANHLGEDNEIRKNLFLAAEKKLQAFLDSEGPKGVRTKAVVCGGVPYLEIDKKAHEFKVDLIVIGSCGSAADTERIFFGTTAEKVLRFVTHPVLCVPPESDHKIIKC